MLKKTVTAVSMFALSMFMAGSTLAAQPLTFNGHGAADAQFIYQGGYGVGWNPPNPNVNVSIESRCDGSHTTLESSFKSNSKQFNFHLTNLTAVKCYRLAGFGGKPNWNTQSGTGTGTLCSQGDCVVARARWDLVDNKEPGWGYKHDYLDFELFGVSVLPAHGHDQNNIAQYGVAGRFLVGDSHYVGWNANGTYTGAGNFQALGTQNPLISCHTLCL